jgi:hypothetical protein
LSLREVYIDLNDSVVSNASYMLYLDRANVNFSSATAVAQPQTIRPVVITFGGVK